MMPSISQTDLARIIELAERFAARELEPVRLEADRYPFAPYPRSIYENALATGLARAALPERFGGTGTGYTALGAILNTLARTDASPAFLIMVQNLVREIIIHGFLEENALESCKMGGDGVSELIAFPAFQDLEGAGSGISAVETVEGYRLTGNAANLACLPEASGAFLHADFSGKPLWAFVNLKEQNKGVSIKDPVVTLGLRACPMGDLELTGVLIPPNRAFVESNAHAGLRSIVDQYRIMAAGLSLGVLEGAFQTAKAYAEQRRQAKKRIIEHHMVRRMLAKMAADIDLGRAALEQCMASIDGKTGSRSTEMISLQERISAFAARGTTDAVQVLGGCGYMHDYGQEKRMRDAKQLQAVFGGSDARIMKIADRI